LASADINFKTDEPNYLVFSGSEATELFDFIPDDGYFDLENGARLNFSYVDYKCIEYGVVTDGPQGGGSIGCVKYSNEVIDTVKSLSASGGLECIQIAATGVTTCKIYLSNAITTLPALKVPFANSQELDNNNLGKLLKDQTFRSSGHHIELGCVTYKPGSYYDCYWNLKP
jgi:hypothetical protein